MFQRAKRLLRDTQGAVFTEYVVIVGFVALLTGPSVLYCAWLLAAHFARARWYILSAIP
jgi:hypothetical protein